MYPRWLIGVTLLALAGCSDHNHYEVTITPGEATFERRLSVERVPESRQARVPRDDVLALERAYPERLSPEGSQRHDFRGQFTESMPYDIGNFGSLTRQETRLGSASTYMERVRGIDDLDAWLFDKRAAVDRAVDLLIGWFESHLADDPQWPALRRFLHQTVRQDARNLVLLTWQSLTARTDATPAEEQESLARLLSFLLERKYVRLSDLPRIQRMQAANDSEALLEFVRQRLVERTAVDDPAALRQSLAFLTDLPALEISVNEYLRSTPEYEAIERRWRDRLSRDPGLERPEAVEVLTQVVGHDMLNLSDAWRPPDTLNLTLHTRVEPHQTNGDWGPATRAVRWEVKLKPTSMSKVCYAVWSEPNRDYQLARFGRVALAGEGLANYVAWYHGLTSGERAEWDAFVDALQPADNHRARIEAFQFTPAAYYKGPEGLTLPPPPAIDILGGAFPDKP